jgi:hypothetical protein
MHGSSAGGAGAVKGGGAYHIRAQQGTDKTGHKNGPGCPVDWPHQTVTWAYHRQMAPLPPPPARLWRTIAVEPIGPLLVRVTERDLKSNEERTTEVNLSRAAPRAFVPAPVVVPPNLMFNMTVPVLQVP